MPGLALSAFNTRLWRGIRVARFWHALARCVQLHRSRQDLRALCPHLRRDLGLTKGDVAREVAKPCWRM